MPYTTASQGSLEELRQTLETLVECSAPGASPDLAEATHGLIAAIDYKDNALLKSRSEAMGAAFADTADRHITAATRGQERLRDFCRRVRSLNGPPSAEFDALGKACESLFDTVEQRLAEVKDVWVRVATDLGHDVPRADELESLIREVGELRKSTLTGWPWTSQGLPPVNRKMVAGSRVAYPRGEGEPLGDWLNREASHPSKG